MDTEEIEVVVTEIEVVEVAVAMAEVAVVVTEVEVEEVEEVGEVEVATEKALRGIWWRVLAGCLLAYDSCIALVLSYL